MAENTPRPTKNTATSVINTITTAVSAGATLEKARQSLTSWVDCFGSYEELKTKLTRILSATKPSESADKTLKLTPKGCSDIRQCCSRVTNYSKDYFNFDLQSEVTEAVGDGVHCIDRKKLENLLSKLNASMTKQLERMLYGELVKTSAQTIQMIGALTNTLFVIRESKQYRRSGTLQQATARIKENLEKAEQFYQTAKNEIDRIETTPIAHPRQYTLEQIALNLDRAKFESECARKELDAILRDISQMLQKLSSNRTNHGVNIGMSLLNVAVTALQFASTPSFLLSTTAKVLFATNGGLQAINTIGHSIGCCWSHEEIHKLEEIQHELKTLEATMKDSFEKINYGVEKLERIKQQIAVVPDPEVVVEE